MITSLNTLKLRWCWFIFLGTIAGAMLIGILDFAPLDAMLATDRYRIFFTACLIVVSAMVFVSPKILATPSKPYLLSLLTFAALGLLSSMLSALPRYALLEWAMFIGSAMLGLGIVRASKKASAEKMVTGLLTVIFMAVCAYSMYYLYWYFNKITCLRTYCVQLYLPGFDNPRAFDVIFLPLLLLYPQTIRFLPSRPLIRASYWLLGAVWFSLLFVSGSRTSYLAIPLIGALAMALSPRTAWPWLKRLVIFLIFGGAVFWLLHSWWPSLWPENLLPITPTQFNVASTGSAYARAELWRRAFTIFTNHPWIGAGPMHFAYYGDIPHINDGAHPHNLTFQLLAEWGLICTLLFYAGALTLFTKSVQYFRRSQPPPQDHSQITLLVLFCAWCAMLFAAQASATNLQIFAGFSGILTGLIVQPQQSVQPHSGRIYFLGVRLAALAVIACFIQGIYPEVTCRSAENAAYYKQYPGEAIWPRFWAQGKIAFSNNYLRQCLQDAKTIGHQSEK